MSYSFYFVYPTSYDTKNINSKKEEDLKNSKNNIIPSTIYFINHNSKVA